MGLITQFPNLTTESTLEIILVEAGLLFLIAKILLIEGRRVVTAYHL